MGSRRTYLKLVADLEFTITEQTAKIARLKRQNEKLKARCVKALCVATKPQPFDFKRATKEMSEIQKVPNKWQTRSRP